MIHSGPLLALALWAGPAHATDEVPDTAPADEAPGAPPATDEDTVSGGGAIDSDAPQDPDPQGTAPEGTAPEGSDPQGSDPQGTPSTGPDGDDLERYRARFDVLADRAIGTTSRPVEFNWRRSPAQLALTGSYLSELNNFNSMRAGAAVRLPTGGVLMELGLSYAAVWHSPSSRLLALTPYRQPGRPDRMELDVVLGLPLAEGIVTTAPSFFPAVQLVFNAYAGLRYLIYPTGFAQMRPGEVTSAILSPLLTEIELENLERSRLSSMQLDLGRYGLMFGLGNDLYFKQGLFLSPRLLLAIPLLAPATQTELLMWADFSLSIGVAL